jgi:hypothetical protein
MERGIRESESRFHCFNAASRAAAGCTPDFLSPLRPAAGELREGRRRPIIYHGGSHYEHS